MALGQPPADDAVAQATDARIAALEAALAESNARNAQLLEQVSKLMAQVEAPHREAGPELEELTSSAFERWARRRLRREEYIHTIDAEKPKKKSKRKRGGQPGHRGSHRELLPTSECVNAVINFFPKVCLGCAADLAEVADLSPYRYQLLDLRDHRPHLTEYRSIVAMRSNAHAAVRARLPRMTLRFHRRPSARV